MNTQQTIRPYIIGPQSLMRILSRNPNHASSRLLIGSLAYKRKDTNRSRCHGNGRGKNTSRQFTAHLQGTTRPATLISAALRKIAGVYKIKKLQAQMECDVNQKHCSLVSYFCKGLECGGAKCMQSLIRDSLQKATACFDRFKPGGYNTYHLL